MHRDIVTRGDDHQAEPRGVPLGRGRRASARWSVGGDPADYAAGRLVPAVADGLGGQAARSDVPRLDASAVAHVDLPDARARQQPRQHRAHPSRTPHTHPLGASGGQVSDRVARYRRGQGQ
ncbi:hypothetical protein RKD40_002709 [Streptomyces ambofaciens]